MAEKEKLYTIPVNDAFNKGSECPICSMYQKLEDDSISFMMGPSYMEDDIRMETDELGFCKRHMQMLAVQKNRLGLALILKTHLDRQYKEAEALNRKPARAGAFLKKKEKDPVAAWAEKKIEDCYICKRIAITFPHYIDTTLKLYKKDPEFREKYKNCKGFCQEHLGLLLEKGQEVLSDKEYQEFKETTVRLYLDNIKRLSDDLDWFADKFDYLHRNDPWKNSKDAIERAVVKTNGILPPEDSEV